MVEKQVLESFVARIWLERGPNGDALWRGHVRHVQGDQETFFQDIEAMTEFLERVSGVPGLGRTGLGRTGLGRTGQPGEDDASSEPGSASQRIDD